MKNLISISLLVCMVFMACNKQKTVTNIADYQVYLLDRENENLAKINEQISFWLEKDSVNPTHTYKIQLANLYSVKYKLDGKVENLKKAQSLLEVLIDVLAENNATVYRMAAANAISQHEFKKAYEFALKASQIKDKQYESKLVLYDACMELGYYGQAESILAELQDKESFAYQIRQAKWLDYKGKLDQAVTLMEQGLAEISPNNDKLRLWTLSNLGDMYGHQGKVDQAYQAYLKALAIDEDYYYALKGIAYIAYAHDSKISEAKKILEFLDQAHPIPDYKLMLAEIAAFEGMTEKSKAYEEAFYAEVSQEKYGKMYNKYLLDLDLAAQRYDKALALAKSEVAHRPTPQTYDFLAWSYFQAGEKVKALELAQKYVENKTFEPDASFHLGMLYAEFDQEKAVGHLKEALSARFELGPLTSKEIRDALDSI